MSALRSALVAVLAVAAMAASATAVHADECDQACQVGWAWAAQQQNALPRTGFYDAPDPLRWAPLGALIRKQETSEYVVEGKPVTATRVLYHSRTSAGRDVAVSGVVLVPQDRPRPRGGWKVVVDAHGASGIGTACAPSLMRDLYHGNQMMRFLGQGYAVVAPDYAGLGTTGRPEFLNKAAQAADLVGAVRSARQAMPGLSRQWVLWGHSQGGGAALAVAERQTREPEPGYLGAVVTSAAADLTALVDHLAVTSPYGGFVPIIAKGASYGDERIQPQDLLTQAAHQRLDTIRDGCLNVAVAVYADVTGPALLQPGWLSNPAFAGYLRDNSLGRARVAGPVLFLQGDADTVTPRAVADQVAAGLCRADSTIDYRTYPGLEHDTWGGSTGIDDGAMPDILAWTKARFAGLPAASTCLK
ncbi:alpha/beta fold hydrolase [Nonomuraea sp. NPDC052129]|uniref:alpha/beta fold hydrolase n=1 Tax=Nonomuraea sp. NPDC052129 TaxID=3154651 RepID=UPI003429E0D1